MTVNEQTKQTHLSIIDRWWLDQKVMTSQPVWWMKTSLSFTIRQLSLLSLLRSTNNLTTNSLLVTFLCWLRIIQTDQLRPPLEMESFLFEIKDMRAVQANHATIALFSCITKACCAVFAFWACLTSPPPVIVPAEWEDVTSSSWSCREEKAKTAATTNSSSALFQSAKIHRHDDLFLKWWFSVDC